MSALLGLVDALSCRLIVAGVSIELTQHRFRRGAGVHGGRLGFMWCLQHRLFPAF